MNADEMSEMFTVKEVLFQIQQQIEICEQMGETSIRNERNKVLLNYITNLQKENEKLNISNRCLRSANSTLDERSSAFRKLFEDYKSRNEKAVESIEDCKKTNGDKYTCIIDHNYLLNILQGGNE